MFLKSDKQAPCGELKVLQMFLEIPCKCFILSIMPFVLSQMFCEGLLQFFFFGFKAIQRCSCRLRCSEPIVGGSAGQRPPNRFVNLLEIIHSALLHLHISFLTLILKLIILSRNLISLLKFHIQNRHSSRKSLDALQFAVDFDFTSQVLREKQLVFVHHTLR